MMYLLHGADQFRLRQRIRELTCPPESDAACAEVDGVHLDTDQLSQILSAQSFLVSVRPTVIHNLLNEGDSNTQRWFTEWLASGATSEAVVIFVETDLPKKSSSWQPYLRNWQVEAYPPLTFTETKDWLQQQATLAGVQLNGPVIQKLTADFGNDLWRLSNELAKLAVFSPQQTIDLSTLSVLVVPTLPDNIFQAIDALASKNLALANRLVNTQLAVGNSETELLTMMAYQFRNIALIKNLIESKIPPDQLATKTGLHPYAVKKSLVFVRSFSWGQLQRIFYLLQKIDTAIKQGQTPPKAGLDILIAQIVSC